MEMAKEEIEQLGLKSRQFVEKWHCPQKTTKKSSEGYEMKNILISDNIQTQDKFIIDAIYESEITIFDSADISHLKSINISDIKEVILSTLNPDIIEFIIEEFKKINSFLEP